MVEEWFLVGGGQPGREVFADGTDMEINIVDVETMAEVVYHSLGV